MQQGAGGVDGDVDLLRSVLQVPLDSIKDAEVSAQTGAQHSERNPERLTYRLPGMISGERYARWA